MSNSFQSHSSTYLHSFGRLSIRKNANELELMTMSETRQFRSTSGNTYAPEKRNVTIGLTQKEEKNKIGKKNNWTCRQPRTKRKNKMFTWAPYSMRHSDRLTLHSKPYHIPIRTSSLILCNGAINIEVMN